MSSASPTLTLNRRTIGADNACYVIAEVGHNHQGNLERAMELMRAARECGAHAVKLQKRHNRTLFTGHLYDMPYDNPNSFGATYGEHREFLEFGREEYLALKELAREVEIDFFATAFDVPSADFLDELEMPAYKIASADLTNLPLLRHVAGFGKPMFVSTGGATLGEVRRAYDLVRAINPRICLLQCTSGYPCEFDEMSLRVIETYRREFPEAVVGLSAHDSGIAMAPVAYTLGARVIEKHFTLNRAWKGTDHAFSLERPGLRRMVRDLQRVRVALGNGEKKIYDSEVAPMRKMRKKIVAASALPAGHVLAESDLALKSPGDGLSGSFFYDVIGRKLKAALCEDESVTLESVE
jgi:sialic acid synthase